MAKSLYICYFGMREPLVQTQVLPYLRELVKGNAEVNGVNPDHALADTRANAKTRERGEDGEGKDIDYALADTRANAKTRERGEDADENNRPPRQPRAATPPNSGGELKVSLLTFEPEMKQKWTAEQIAAEREKLAAEGIDWHCLPYHKRFSAIATAWDIFCGAVRVWRLNLREKFDILHCRVHVPGMMALLASFFSLHKPKILFDIRGFFPEEFVDAGLWKKDSAIFKAAKAVERRIVKKAVGFVVLTNKAREIMFPDAKGSTAEGWTESQGRPVEVIPCCVDFKRRFSGDGQTLGNEIKDRFGLHGRKVITHLGALGGLYYTEHIAELMAAAKKQDPSVFAMFVTQSNPELIAPLLKQNGFTDKDYFAGRIDPLEIEKYLYASDIGVSFVQATLATQSRSPTKIPEYLACGLPIIANPGVGDVDDLINEHSVGALIDGFDEKSYLAALEKIEELGDISQHCRNIAVSEFDLENVGGKRYRRLYANILK